MENFNQSSKIEKIIRAEDLVVDQHYKISAPYSRGKYEGQVFDGEVKYLNESSDADGNPMYHFLYIKEPEHLEEVGGGSTYVTNKEGLQYIKELN